MEKIGIEEAEFLGKLLDLMYWSLQYVRAAVVHCSVTAERRAMQELEPGWLAFAAALTGIPRNLCREQGLEQGFAKSYQQPGCGL